MKHLLIIYITFPLLFVVGCGNNTNHQDNNLSNSHTMVDNRPIATIDNDHQEEVNGSSILEETNRTIALPKCQESNSNNGYLIQEAGVIKKDEENTTLEMWHFDNGDKVVCVNTGKAVFVPTLY